MQRKKPDVDVVQDVLKETLQANPSSKFIESLLYQYQERGSLSKKQLEGLHSKASRVTTIARGKLATLEAIILKKPTRYKSVVPGPGPLQTKDTAIGLLINAILEKYPQHKRVLFYKIRYDNNEALSPADKSEIERFHKLLV